MARWPVGHLVQLLGDCQPECCLVGRLTLATAAASTSQRHTRQPLQASRQHLPHCRLAQRFAASAVMEHAISRTLTLLDIAA